VKPAGPSTTLADSRARRDVWRVAAAIFVAAVALNYLWELAQTPLYLGMNDFRWMLWHCFAPTLGDGLLVLLIFAAGVAIFHRQDWFCRPGIHGYVLMLSAGLVIGVVVEFVAVHGLGQWKYAARMPILPFVGVGLAPIAQMVVLPPILFRVAAAWWNRAR
jgi:hypothetical protein